MKILHLIPQLNYGGTESVVLRFNEKLNELGHESSIVVFSDKNPREAKNTKLIICGHQNDVRINLLKANSKHLEYEKLIDDYKPDVIHSHSMSSHIIALAGKRKNLRYLLHFHRFIDEDRPFGLNEIKQQIILTYLIQRYGKTSIVYVSEALKRSIFRRFPFLQFIANDFYKVPNPIILKNLEAIPDQQTDQYKLISISRLESEKNIEMLPEIGKTLLEKGINLKWDIYGDGKEKNALKKSIEKNNLNKVVSIKEPRTDLEKIFRNYDLLISLSIKETFGLSILEAMAQNLPVLALKNEGSDEFLENDLNSIYINNDGPEVIVKSIISLLTNSEKKAELKKNAFATAKSYDLNLIVEDLIKIYRN